MRQTAHKRGTWIEGFGVSIYRPTLEEERDHEAMLLERKRTPRVERCALGRATVFVVPGQDAIGMLAPWGSGWAEASRESQGGLDRVELTKTNLS